MRALTAGFLALILASTGTAAVASAAGTSVTSWSESGVVSAVVTSGSSITGTVYLGGTATRAGAGEVTVKYAFNQGPFVAANAVDTDSQGNFSISGLAAGGWNLFYQYNGTGAYFSAWYGQDKYGATPPGVGTLNLDGVSPFPDASAILESTAEIVGRVALGTATNFAGAGDVEIWWSRFLGEGTWTSGFGGVTDSSGSYRLENMPPSKWYQIRFVYVGSDPQWQKESSYGPSSVASSGEGTSLSIQQGGTTDLETRAIPATQSLSGRVSLGSPSNPAGEGDVVVTAKRYLSGAAATVTTATTDSSGNFEVGGLDNDVVYELKFQYAGTGSFTYVPPTLLSRTPATGLSMTIGAGYTMSGTVSLGESGIAPGAGQVRVTADPVACCGFVGLSAFTDDAGRYSIRGVPPGPHRLSFEYSGAGNFPVWYWASDSSGKCFRLCASEIRLTQDTSGFDMVLTPIAGASGSVRGVSNSPIAGATVYLTGYFPAGINQGRYLNLQATTNQNGNYAFALSPTEELLYAIEFEAPGFSAQSWDNLSRYYVPDITDFLDPGNNGVHNATLYASSTIGGTVSGKRLTPARAQNVKVEVMVLDGRSGLWVRTGDIYSVDSAGNYSIPNLFPDGYKLAFDYNRDGQKATRVSGITTVSEGTSKTLNFVLNLPPKVTRLSGADRYDVGVSVSKQLNQDPVGEVPVVYVANGANFPDALSAAPAAVLEGGPLLLTPVDGLPTAVRNEIVRLSPSRIVIVGGPGSVSTAVETQLRSIVGVGNVKRLGGTDRYAASRNVVREIWNVGEVGTGPLPVVYVATGGNFPDALSASAAAGAVGAPVLLVEGDATSLDAETRELLLEMRPGIIKVAGGSVQSQIRADLQAIAPISFLGGADRFVASQAINNEAIRSGSFALGSPTYLTTGFNFPDGLVGAALAGQQGAPLYTVPGNCIPIPVLAQAEALQSDEIILLGGSGTLTPAVYALAPCIAAAQGESRAPTNIEQGDGPPARRADSTEAIADWIVDYRRELLPRLTP